MDNPDTSDLIPNTKFRAPNTVALAVSPTTGTLAYVYTNYKRGAGNGDILIVELLGNETVVHLNAGGQALIARLPGLVDVQVGTRVGLKLDRRHLHLFDASGLRIT